MKYNKRIWQILSAYYLVDLIDSKCKYLHSARHFSRHVRKVIRFENSNLQASCQSNYVSEDQSSRPQN